MTSDKKKFGLFTASAFVIANMIGTGVFTSLGFQLLTTQNFIAVMCLWFLGGVIAFCGAVSYAELGAAMPRSGGEYHYLSQIYSPAVGFLSGWVSLIVGFAAPVALACMALSSYVGRIYPGINQTLLAAGVLTLVTALHMLSHSFSGKFQNVFTSIKLIIILVFIIVGFTHTPEAPALAQSAKDFSLSEIFTAGFAVSLIWVYYAYSGWNASTYMANEIENPQKNLPLSLLLSTGIVTILYILLNLVFLLSAPVGELTGQVEVGLISARHIFGETLGNGMGILIAVLLFSSISSMVFMGPRVAQVMGEDHKIFRFLSYKNSKDLPTKAIAFQFCISLIMIITNSFELVTKYTGILLSLCALMTVAGVFVHRKKFPDAPRPYKTWGYPVTPCLFIILILWSICYLFYEDFTKTFVTGEQNVMWMTIMSVVTLGLGVIVYIINKKISANDKQ